MPLPQARCISPDSSASIMVGSMANRSSTYKRYWEAVLNRSVEGYPRSSYMALEQYTGLPSSVQTKLSGVPVAVARPMQAWESSNLLLSSTSSVLILME